MPATGQHLSHAPGSQVYDMRDLLRLTLPAVSHSKAYREAGYEGKAAFVNGHEVLRNPKVKARIAEIRQENEAKARGSLPFIPSLSIRLRCDTAGNVSLSKSLTESGPPDLLRVGAPATATIFIRPRDDTR